MPVLFWKVQYIVFSSNTFNKYDGLFPKTSFFAEEYSHESSGDEGQFAYYK